MEKQRVMCRRLVLVPLPFQGHINPMLQLGSILHSKGFSITVIHTVFNSPDPSNHPEFRFVSIPHNLSDQIISSGNLVTLISALNVTFQVPLLECLIRMVQNHEDIACIIYDELMFISEAAAKHVNLPSIMLRTTSALTFISRAAIQPLKAQGLLTLQGSMSENLVSELHPLRFKDLPVSKFGTPDHFLQLISNISQTRTSSAVIWNTSDVLEQSSLTKIQTQCSVPIFPIGPLHKFHRELKCICQRYSSWATTYHLEKFCKEDRKENGGYNDGDAHKCKGKEDSS
ncbi:UDP-glucuronosyl/UDP-glucosyltransferase [Corchorus olitorius]|uniref:UDP-glucuronosyl/UDP-glucosyltransferase n=1 Tax=Corchorus olitorius TaxID=93759 RepID=A0A1R3J8N6_9ROSI|nr:UDP-glucuronosyl/UDP-glucosyltransferase [Corchorus olitorius]